MRERAVPTIVKRRPKALREGRIAGLRKVYVSWKTGDDREKIEWKVDFFERLHADTLNLTEAFAEPAETGSLPSGVLVEHALEEQLNPVTDIVGVMTLKYATENAKPAGELARVIEQVKSADRQDRVRVWLAPVDRFVWGRYRVCDVPLNDPERPWLVRLKGDSQRFVWPGEPPLGRSDDEIADAVNVIIGNDTDK